MQKFGHEGIPHKHTNQLERRSVAARIMRFVRLTKKDQVFQGGIHEAHTSMERGRGFEFSTESVKLLVHGLKRESGFESEVGPFTINAFERHIERWCEEHGLLKERGAASRNAGQPEAVMAS